MEMEISTLEELNYEILLMRSLVPDLLIEQRSDLLLQSVDLSFHLSLVLLVASCSIVSLYPEILHRLLKLLDLCLNYIALRRDEHEFILARGLPGHKVSP
jgi:hypothetical protein